VHVPPELLDRSLPVGMAAGLEGTRWWSVLECDPETLVEVFEALGEIREIGED
jgi:hypothetical protein